MMEDNCEVTRCKIKGMKTKQWFVRLGSQYYGDLGVPDTKGHAPRVQNIRAIRQDFQDAASKLPSPRHEAELPEEEEANEAGHNDETGDRYEMT
jgi:hypothetical protein